MLDELHALVDFFQKLNHVHLFQPLDEDLDNGERHLAQGRQRLVAMDALFEIDLGDGPEAKGIEEIDQQAGLNAVSGKKRDLLQGRSPAAVLARQGLENPGQLGEKKIQERPRGKLGHPAPALGIGFPVHFQGTTVKTFHILNLRLLEKGTENPIDKAGMDVLDIGVDPNYQIALEHVKTLPQSLPLTTIRSILRQDLLVNVYRYAEILRDLYRFIRGARIDQHDLIQKRPFFKETFFQSADNIPDSLRFIEGGQSQADGQSLLFFQLLQLLKIIEFPSMKGVLGKPFVHSLGEGTRLFPGRRLAKLRDFGRRGFDHHQRLLRLTHH